MKKKISIHAILSLLLLISGQGFCQKLPKNYGKLQAKLFIPESSNKSLIVAFGGSEGGNTFALEKTKEVRDNFLNRGFHFLAIGYFGSKGIPKTLDRISLSAVYDSIQSISSRLEIVSSRIVLLGASRGGELVLNLASHYDFPGVIALVPSNVTVPNLNNKAPTSSWTLNDKEVPFIQIDEKEVNQEGWSPALKKSLSGQQEDSPGFIPVENINGFVFLTSGKTDTMWPSFDMCNGIMNRLKINNFQHPFVHEAFEQGHNPSTHWPKVFEFLDELGF